MPETQQQPKNGFYGWINLVLLFIVYGSIYGFVFYGFTVVFPEMIKATGWSRGSASVAHTMRGFSLGVLAPLVAIAIAKFGAKRTMIAGVIIGVVAMGLLGTATSQLWQWIVLWGFIMPLSFSFGGAIPIQTVLTYWFNIKRGLTLGLVLASGPLAGFVAAPLFTYIMLKTGRWETGWLTAGGFCVLALIVTFFLKNKPEDIGQFPDGIDPDMKADTDDDIKPKAAKTYRTNDAWLFKEAIKKPAVYLLAFCMVSQASAIYLLTTHGVLHFTDMGFDSMKAASVIGNMILFSGLARFPVGYLGDRIEPSRIVAIALVGMGVSLIGLWKAPESLVTLLALASVYGFCFGAMVPMFPMIIGNYFGPASFASVTGFLTPIGVLFGAPVPMVAGIIYDKTQNYDFAFVYTIVLTMAAAVCAFALKPPEKTGNR